MIIASGGTGSYTYSATGLPPGLTIDAGTGILSGTPSSTTGSPFSVTVTVTDTASVKVNKVYSLVVNPLPALSVSIGHTANFTQGETGATYIVTVKNGASAGPSAGLVSVTDNLPLGLAATGINGTGWTCGLATLTCTRNDTLTPGSSYPLSVTVNVASNAASSVTNQVGVSGGSSVAANANDPTTIYQPLRHQSETRASPFRMFNA